MVIDWSTSAPAEWGPFIFHPKQGPWWWKLQPLRELPCKVCKCCLETLQVSGGGQLPPVFLCVTRGWVGAGTLLLCPGWMRSDRVFLVLLSAHSGWHHNIYRVFRRQWSYRHRWWTKRADRIHHPVQSGGPGMWAPTCSVDSLRGVYCSWYLPYRHNPYLLQPP